MTARRPPADPTRVRRAIVVFASALASALAWPGLLAPARLHAQVAVFPIQNLRFGTLRAGMPEYVDADDVARRAELQIVGSGRVVVTFALPAEMTSVGGHRVPLEFRKGDAMLVTRDGDRDQDFDPNKPKQFNIKPGDGGGTLCLGGTALPDASQPPGRYTAMITIQVVTPGT
jgi:hypothetical protein